MNSTGLLLVKKAAADSGQLLGLDNGQAGVEGVVDNDPAVGSGHDHAAKAAAAYTVSGAVGGEQ